MPAVMRLTGPHQVDPSRERTDRRASGDPADDVEQFRIVHDKEQQAEGTVLIHAGLARESFVFPVRKMRATHGLPDQFKQVRIDKPWQPDDVRGLERTAHGIERVGLLRADECGAGELQHVPRL